MKFSTQPALKADATVARQAAANGMVLLRNEGAALPLPSGRKVALFGNTFYNLLAGGTGSGDVNRAYTISIAQGLGGAGYAVNAPLSQTYAQYLKAEKAKLPTKKGLLEPAPVIAEMAPPAALGQQQAQANDVAVVTPGRSAGEGGDRKVANDFTLTAAEQALLKQVAAAFHGAGKKVVVLNVGGVTKVASWCGQADAILLAGPPGQEGGHAVADVLSGKVTPSGKLATTFPMSYADIPYGADFPGKLPAGGAKAGNTLMGQPSENTCSEGIYVGYRYYNTFRKRPAYEFGYGLSYGTFGRGPLKLSAASFSGSLTASLAVTNTGKVAGQEVVQLYLSAPAGQLDKPASKLKAFAKTKLLPPGQSQTLTFTLQPADLALFNTASPSWVADAGTYTVQTGASSLNSKQRATFQLPAALAVEKSRPLRAPQAPITELKVARK